MILHAALQGLSSGIVIGEIAAVHQFGFHIALGFLLTEARDGSWLQAVTELSWRSSTRLVIHFGDYPCHGKKYHGEDWEQYDRYPVGDPEGKSHPTSTMYLLGLLQTGFVHCYYQSCHMIRWSY